MFSNELELGYLKELIEKIQKEDLTSFKDAVDYTCDLECGNGYNDQYLRLLVEHTEFFKEYFSVYEARNRNIQENLLYYIQKLVNEKNDKK